MLPTQIARVVHEGNRALQIEQADPTIEVSLPWDDTDLETRVSAISGVEGVIEGNTPEESHAAWTQFKIDNGWTLGPVKDMELKEHPLLIPYAELPASQQIKDALFVAIVHALMTPPMSAAARGKSWADLPADLRPTHTKHIWAKHSPSTIGGQAVWACDCGLWQSIQPVETVIYPTTGTYVAPSSRPGVTISGATFPRMGTGPQ